MVWAQVAVDRPHLVYIILGGFTSLFMLCSSIIKEKLYIGEATVATIVGIIFGPHAANLINPLDWGNTDQITLEFSRIVLVVQCFAVGVELPKMYMNRHWKSVSLLLVPVMGFGWIMTTLFIWWMFHDKLSFLGSLCVAACVTATDPVLASSVVGKGKFAKRVPKHLRDLLSAESGCNDGMAFPFIYLALYLLRYNLQAKEVTFHWICYTILYECVFGAVYGVLVGYIARRAIRFAHERDLIDRESFLVFYFVLALFCAGSGSILGIDDLLVGFACGVGFSNDGWFQEKTEESHVSNVIDLLINLTFFVYFGTIIPWEQFNNATIGTSAWRLVVVGIFVLLFRRIPIMMMLKPIIKDLKTWREALFAGHFGPIGVGAIFVAIMARAELEHESTFPLPQNEISATSEHINIITLIWPITTFLVICSIIVHGSSVAVFTLGRHINTLTLSFSFTTAVEDGPTWMERLPRISSRSKSSMSLQRPDSDAETLDEKSPPGLLSPRNVPKNFLRRQKEEDAPSRSSSRASRKRRKWDQGIGPGGPISQSAIMPTSRLRQQYAGEQEQSEDVADQIVSPTSSPEPGSPTPGEPQEEIFREGSNIVIEDEEGNVLETRKARKDTTESEENRLAEQEAKELLRTKDVRHGVSKVEHPEEPSPIQGMPHRPPIRGSTSWWKSRMDNMSTGRRPSEMGTSATQSPIRRGPARAYTFGNTVIVEDEDGEVIKQYQLPSGRAAPIRSGTDLGAKKSRDVLQRMGHYLGGTGREVPANIASSAKDDSAETAVAEEQRLPMEQVETDDKIRFTLAEGGPRLRKDEFINELKKMDTRSRAHAMQELSSAAESVFGRSAGREGDRSGGHQAQQQRRRSEISPTRRNISPNSSAEELHNVKTTETIPGHSVADSLAHFAFESGGKETAAQRRRRRLDGQRSSVTGSSDDILPRRESLTRGRRRDSSSAPPPTSGSFMEEKETEAERKRREAALGVTKEEDSSEEEGDITGFRDYNPRGAPAPRRSSAGSSQRQTTASRSSATPAAQETSEENTRNSGMRLRWGADVGRKP
jgi:sodium/hydrogen antiporter